MNTKAHWLSLWCSIMMLMIGVPEVLRIGPRFLPPSWVIIDSVLPDDLEILWPGLFSIAGVFLLLGSRSVRAMRAGFILSGALFGVWGVAGIYGWATNQGGNIPGSAANFLLGGTFWLIDHYVFVGRHIDEKVAEVSRLDIEAAITRADLADAAP